MPQSARLDFWPNLWMVFLDCCWLSRWSSCMFLLEVDVWPNRWICSADWRAFRPGSTQAPPAKTQRISIIEGGCMQENITMGNVVVKRNWAPRVIFWSESEILSCQVHFTLDVFLLVCWVRFLFGLFPKLRRSSLFKRIYKLSMLLSYCLTDGIAWDHPSHHRTMSLSCDHCNFISDSSLGCTESEVKLERLHHLFKAFLQFTILRWDIKIQAVFLCKSDVHPASIHCRNCLAV